MKPLPALLGVLFLLAGVVWIILLSFAPRAQDERDAAESPAAALPVAESTERDLGATAAADPTLQVVPETDEAQERSELAAVSDARWVDGQVSFASDLGADPELEAFAVRREARYGQMVRWIELGDDALLTRAPVDADGRFRLELAADTEEVWVGVRGRYLYAPRTVHADLTEGSGEVHLSTRAGACLVGHVTLPAPEPSEAPDATSELELEVRTELGNMNPASEASRDTRLRVEPRIEDGRFVLRGVPVESDYVVVCEHPHFAALAEMVRELEPGVEREVEVALSRGGTVSGRVVDGSGAGVAGAEARAFRPGRFFGLDDEPVRAAETDAEGAFVLEGVSSGSIRVTARAPGYLESDKVHLEVTEGERIAGVMIALDDGNSIEGRVSWEDGRPAKGVKVSVDFDLAHTSGLEVLGALRGADSSTTSAKDGSFRVTGLGAGPFLVRANERAPLEGAPGAEPEEAKEGDDDTSVLWRARTDSVHPGATGLELVLRPPIAMHGHVVDLEGQPVLTFRLHLRRAAEGPMAGLAEEEFRRSESFESDDGAFVLEGLEPGSYQLWVQDEGYVSLELTPAEIPGTAPIVVSAVRTATIHGDVRTTAGDPLEGARVTVGSGGLDLSSLVAGGVEPPAATSGEGGRFTLAGVPPRPATVSAEAEDWARSAAVEVDPGPGAVLEEVHLVVTEGGTLTGEVYDNEGERAPGRMITIVGLDSMVTGSGISQRVGRSDAAGEFRFEHLEPGSWQVTAMDAAAEWGGDDGEMDLGSIVSSLKMSQADVFESETTHVVVGAPPEDPVRVYGTVQIAGEPYGGSTVSFYPRGGRLYEGLKFTAVDDDGRYELVLDGAGDYLASVQQLGKQPGQQSTLEFSVEIPEGEEHELDFDLPLGRISGLVRGPDGEPAEGERVTLVRDEDARSDSLFGGHMSELSTDDNGRFDIRALRPGRYRLSSGGASFLGMGGGKLGRVTQSGIQVGEDEWIDDIELRLPAAGTAAVLARGPGGSPVPGATVFLRDEEGRPVEPLSMVQTDSGGRAEIEGLAPGSYTALARTSTLTSVESGPFHVREGQRAEIELALGEGTILWVTLREGGAGGEPVVGSIRVEDERGRIVSNLLGFQDIQNLYIDGGFSPNEHRLGPLPPGRYIVYAMSDGKQTKKPVTLKAGDERKLTLRLK